MILTEIRRECELERSKMTATSANARTFLSTLELDEMTMKYPKYHKKINAVLAPGDLSGMVAEKAANLAISQ